MAPAAKWTVRFLRTLPLTCFEKACPERQHRWVSGMSQSGKLEAGPAELCPCLDRRFAQQHADLFVCLQCNAVDAHSAVRLVLGMRPRDINCIIARHALHVMCCALAVISHMACMCSISLGSGICWPSWCSQLVVSCQVLLVSSLQALQLTISAKSTMTSLGSVSSYASPALQKCAEFNIGMR